MSDIQARLDVQMLGKFSMTYQGNKVQVGKNQTTKALQLLQILLYVGADGISRVQLLEYLFGRDADGDVANNLRVTVYNLRKMLISSGLPDENYIRVEGGKYRFVSSFPIDVDSVNFEKKVRAASKEYGSARLKLLREASNMYVGYFLPALAGEEWVAVASAHYQQLYFSCMEEICEMMKDRREYTELLELCNRAVSMYPFDEWQIHQIDCLLALNRPKEAMALYEKTTALYFDELGLPPSDRMMERFRRMSGQIRLSASNLTDIQDGLKEKERIRGAYYCPYPSFVDSYRMVVRAMERSGQSVYLMLCTISDEKEKLLDDQDRLKDV
ncbi:MAG: transcriptional regulator, partial [Lachnospiraceae bacterium]|nr:transcriptional regulator [Lachnospiraceae bacterium]